MTDPRTSVSTLVEPIVRAAAATPDHPAVVLGDEALSYGQLARRMDAVAAFLVDHGVQRGDRVGLYAHKSIDLVVALFGVMRAGAAYVPINPEAPADYARGIIAECEIRHLVTGPSRRRAALEAAGPGVELVVGVAPATDDPVPAVDWPEVHATTGPAQDVGPGPDDLAYIIFTSGSTGRPKGIMHSHRTGLAYAKAALAAYGFEPSDRITNHAPLNFDLSTLELFAGTMAGATVVVVPEAHARLPASLARLIETQRVSVVNAVPFALSQLLHRGALEERDLSAVRWVLFGGEVFPTRDLRDLMARLPHAAFANVYGPAEVNGCTFHVVEDLDPEDDRPIPIGRPYPGMATLVVDEQDHPVEAGQVGELLVDSPTHMLGYWGRPDLTERSRHCVERPDGGQTIYYRTGDLVRESDDGTLEFLGRADRQVQVRGNRVELDEVEAVLAAHPAVERAAVYPGTDDEGGLEVRAAVTLLDGTAEVDEDGLRRHAAARLPRHAVPRVVELVAALPETLSGKADRTALASSAGATDPRPTDHPDGRRA